MRLLSYNIHGCIGRRRMVDPDAILSVIREADADVVALQEVHDEGDTDHSLLRALRETLDYEAILHGPTMRKSNADYGNVLMTRKIPLFDERIDLSFPGREPRGAIRAMIPWEDRRIEIAATHLGLLPKERRAQLRRLADVFDEQGKTPPLIQILMGDLNEWFPFGRAARTLRRRFGQVRTIRTFPARFPLFALDRIHARSAGFVRIEKRTLNSEAARTASDHLPLVGEVKLL